MYNGMVRYGNKKNGLSICFLFIFSIFVLRVFGSASVELSTNNAKNGTNSTTTTTITNRDLSDEGVTTHKTCLQTPGAWLNDIGNWSASAYNSSLCMRSWSDVLLDAKHAIEEQADANVRCLPLAAEWVACSLNLEANGFPTSKNEKDRIETLMDESLLLIDDCCVTMNINEDSDSNSDSETVSGDDLHKLMLSLRAFNLGEWNNTADACVNIHSPGSTDGDGDHNNDEDSKYYFLRFWETHYRPFFYIDDITQQGQQQQEYYKMSVQGIIVISLVVAFSFTMVMVVVVLKHKERKNRRIHID